MSAEQAWETASAGWPEIMRETPEIRQAFDAGRASREDEVEDMRATFRAGHNATIEHLRTAVARAEAAELEVAQMVGPGVLANAQAELATAKAAIAEAFNAGLAKAVEVIETAVNDWGWEDEDGWPHVPMSEVLETIDEQRQGN